MSNEKELKEIIKILKTTANFIAAETQLTRELINEVKRLNREVFEIKHRGGKNGNN